MENEGVGGFGLTCRAPLKIDVRVGDVIAARRKDSPRSLDVATVCWMMHGEDGIRLGAQRLATSATAVGLSPAGNPDSAFHVALRLPALPALKQAESLIAAHGLFRPDRELILDDGMRTHRIAATRPIGMTGSIEHFEIRMLDS